MEFRSSNNHLSQLPFEGGQIKAQVRPTATINLLQQPTAISIQLLKEFLYLR